MTGTKFSCGIGECGSCTMLVKAAAVEWKVPEAECEAVNGAVRHKKSDRQLSYGQLCLKAAQLEVPQEPLLKKAGDFRYMGKRIPRVDIPKKVSGEAVFGLDFTMPDLHFAVLARPPAYGAKPVSYDQKAAEAVKGVRNIIPTPFTRLISAAGSAGARRRISWWRR